MKTKCLILVFIFCFVSLINVNAQPFIYFQKTTTDTTLEKLKHIARYDLATNITEEYTNYVGQHFVLSWDPSQNYLLVSEARIGNTLISCSDTSDIWELEFNDETTNQILYSPERNYLYQFCHNYHTVEGIIKVFDLTSNEQVYTVPVTFQQNANFYVIPTRSVFFSSDRNEIFLFSADSLTNEGQFWTYSLNNNQIINKENLSEFGYEGAEGYSLDFGENGLGIIQSYYLSPTPMSYFNIYNFETDSSSSFVLNNGWAEALFFWNGKYLVTSEIVQDSEVSEKYYPSGVINVYDMDNTEVVKTFNLPDDGTIYTFDNYPNNIYYVIDIEEPTRQIYTLKMDSIFNVLDLTSLNPSSAIVNSPPFTLTVNGHGFDTLSTVFFNDTAKTTTYISDSVLTVEISTSDISVVGNYPVWVTDQWGTSDTLSFSVLPHPPVLTSISPGIVLRYTSGGLPPNGLTVTVTGANFSDSSVAYFNGNAKATTVVSDTVLTFPITGTEMSTLGNYPVWINTYGINSDTLTLQVVDNLITMQLFIPTLQCVQDNGGGSYTAYFGYVNDNGVSIYVPIGSKNKFAPFPIDRGQPKLFEPGTHTNVFSVNFNGRDLIWTLDQTSVTANRNSTPCE